MITTTIKKQVIKIGKELLKKEWGNTYCDDCILKKVGNYYISQHAKDLTKQLLAKRKRQKYYLAIQLEH